MIQSLLVAVLAFTAPPLAALPAAPAAVDATTADPVVHAVMFYSPTCPHCHKVITEDFPPLTKKYGSRLVIAGVDVTTPRGQALYNATVDYFKIDPSRLGVPTLVVGTEVMVGDVEIPQRFPGLIEKGLAEGGTDWPPVPAIRAALAERSAQAGEASGGDSAGAPARDTVAAVVPSDTASPPEPDTSDTTASAAPAGSSTDTTTAPTSAATGTDSTAAALLPDQPGDTVAPPGAGGIGLLGEDIAPSGMWAHFRLDPFANSIAVLVFLGMLVALASSLRSVAAGRPAPLSLPAWALPVLAAVGMAVASYLGLVELTGSAAVCGPVGDCNTVQQSSYALILGMPVGVLGQAGYLGMFIAWALGVLGPRAWRDSAWLALWAMALAGVVFSAYLTFLEPFVIGATCVWCLTSAVVMTLMLMGATPHVASQRR